jgi:uncharacterized NAD-dependent epimerase/dehydratase family protein
MLNKNQSLVIHFDAQIDQTNGKMGHSVLRYSENPVACVIDRNHGGHRTRELLNFGPDVPIVSSVAEALPYAPEALLLGMAPGGGLLPEHMFDEMDQAITAGLSIVNGLHQHLGPRYPTLVPGQWVWDIRQEPQGLGIATAAAADLPNRRLLLVGTDMAIGKMTAGLEIWRAAKEAGCRVSFVATGQIGMVVTGHGIPLDAIRVDYACGAVEQEVMAVKASDLVIVEGQGSLAHPGSTSTLPLMRGACPTHLILCHRAGMTTLDTVRTNSIRVPPLLDLIRLYEDLAAACGSLPAAKTVGISLNTAHMSEEAAARAVEETKAQTGLLVTDPIRYGPKPLFDAVMA